MTKEEAIKILDTIPTIGEQVDALEMAIEALEQQQDWIPIKWHEITEEEREREGYPKEWIWNLDCLMPDDGQEILLTEKYTNRRTGSTRYYVTKDTCFYDVDGYYLDSDLDWRDDVVAWMPLPEPYVPDTNVGEMSESEVEG